MPLLSDHTGYNCNHFLFGRRLYRFRCWRSSCFRFFGWLWCWRSGCFRFFGWLWCWRSGCFRFCWFRSRFHSFCNCCFLSNFSFLCNFTPGVTVSAKNASSAITIPSFSARAITSCSDMSSFLALKNGQYHCCYHNSLAKPRKKYFCFIAF